MRRLLKGLGAVLLALLMGVALCYWALLPPAPLSQPGQGMELRSVVLVVPGQHNREPVDLVIKGDRITGIHSGSPGPVKGYVLPGLVDAHIHAPLLPFPREEELYAFLHLYHGVTLARIAAGDSTMRDAVSAGLYPGPELQSCGPFIDGDPPLWRNNSLVVTDQASAKRAVNNIAAAGYDCIKVYNELTAVASQAVYIAASQHGLPVIGHVPWRQDATVAWIDDQQHLLGLPSAEGRESSGQFTRAMLQLDELDEARLQALASAMTGAEIALTPTLITLQRKFALENYAELAATPTARLLPRYYREQVWDAQRGLVSSRLFSAADFARFREVYPIAQRAIVALHRAGVAIHSGTDSPAEFIVPGAGLIEELHLLRDAGLTAAEVLNIATTATARDLGGDSYGRISTGARANFVVYARNPVEDLANLDSRTAVVRDGRYYSREVLDAQLQRYQDWYDSPVYRAVSGSIVASGLWLMNTLAN